MGEIITSMMQGFTDTMSGLTTGIREGFTSLIYETSAGGEQVLSNLAKFGFVIGGFGLAVSVVFVLFKLIRR